MLGSILWGFLHLEAPFDGRHTGLVVYVCIPHAFLDYSRTNKHTRARALSSLSVAFYTVSRFFLPTLSLSLFLSIAECCWSSNFKLHNQITCQVRSFKTNVSKTA